MAGQLPWQRGTRRGHHRLAPVDGHRDRGDRRAAAGVVVRRFVPGRVDDRMGGKFHADHGRLARPAAGPGPSPRCAACCPAWPSVTATLRGGTTTCGACGSTRGSRTASMSPAASPPSGGTTSSRDGCGTATPSTLHAAGIGAADLVLGRALARVRRPVQRVPHLPQIDHPALAADPAGLRPLVLDFRAFLRQWRRGTTGRRNGAGRWMTARSPAPSGSSGTSTGPCTTTGPMRPRRPAITGGWS